jgi:hypothetical protein
VLSGRKITAKFTGEKRWRDVAKGHPQNGILLPLRCCLVADKVIERLEGNGYFTLGLSIVISRKFLITVTELHQEFLSMEQWCDRNQPSIHPHSFCLKCGAANCMNLRAAKKIMYGQSAWVTGVPTLPVFYSIPFYVYITDTNITSLDKQSSLADSL